MFSKIFPKAIGVSLLVGCVATDPCFEETDTVRAIDTSITQLSAIGVYDINNDGQPDIVAQGIDGEGLYWYEQNDEQFTERFIADGLNNSYELKAEDFDVDGDLDLFVVSDTGKLIYLEQVQIDSDTVDFEAHELDDIVCGAYCQIAIADFDQNGVNDLFICNSAASPCSMFAFSDVNSLEWSRTEIQLYAYYITNFEVIDANGDAYPDIYYSRYSEYTAGIMLNDQAGSFQLQPKPLTDLYGATSFADVTGDGLEDYIYPRGVIGANNEIIGFNDELAVTSQSVASADVDADGDNDIVGSTGNGYYLRINDNGEFLSGGAKRFCELDANYASIHISRPIIITDLNQSGSPDLIGNRLFNGKIFWADIPSLCTVPVI